ncbi:hypothetical protein WR25_04209 [Diploscapter pachys]|uniref:Uncharacterized protein n=1 Tax=Diploscapter pachys TaxID=2018661 RepID=A0A2A2K1A8_9BILA|nr:hypothetical protein WR25_04209 [Diploscapter pachys]
MAAVSNHNYYFDQLLQNHWVKKTLDVYDTTKHSHPMIETTFDKVEGGVQGLGNYVNQKTSGAQQNIADGYNYYVVRPKTAVYNHANSVWTRTRSTWEVVRDKTTYAGTICIGAAVVATQLVLQVLVATIGVSSDILAKGKNVVTSVVGNLKTKQQAIGQYNPAALKQFQNFWQAVVDRSTDVANTVLDIVDSILERSLGVKFEVKTDASLWERLAAYGNQLLGLFNSAAHEKVLDPAQHRIDAMSERVQKLKSDATAKASALRKRVSSAGNGAPKSDENQEN